MHKALGKADCCQKDDREEGGGGVNCSEFSSNWVKRFDSSLSKCDNTHNYGALFIAQGWSRFHEGHSQHTSSPAALEGRLGTQQLYVSSGGQQGYS